MDLDSTPVRQIVSKTIWTANDREQPRGGASAGAYPPSQRGSDHRAMQESDSLFSKIINYNLKNYFSLLKSKPIAVLSKNALLFSIAFGSINIFVI